MGDKLIKNPHRLQESEHSPSPHNVKILHRVCSTTSTACVILVSARKSVKMFHDVGCVIMLVVLCNKCLT